MARLHKRDEAAPGFRRQPFFSALRQRFAARLPDRLRMPLHAMDHYLHGEPELRLVGQLCDPARAAVDVGASIGVYSWFMRRRAARLYIYEPIPAMAARLSRLFPDAVVRAAAVSDQEGTGTLQMPRRHGRTIHERAGLGAAVPGDTGFERLTVPMVRLDDEPIEPVGFLKVDVEQHEIPVLTGATGLIARDRPVIMTEVAPLLYDAPLPQTFAFLADLGYEGWFCFRGRHYPLSQFDPARHAAKENWGGPDFMNSNMIFLPVERGAEAILPTLG